MNLIVLDIDGTLTHSEYQHQNAFIETMKYFGITEINTNWRTYKHMTDSCILKVNYENNLDQLFGLDFVDEFEKVMMDKILKFNPVVEIQGAHNFLLKMRGQAGWGLCFATGSFLMPALLKLKQAGIFHSEELVVGSNGLFSREEIVLAAIDRAKKLYQVSGFKNIIAIGDGIWDYRTAEHLGLHFIGIGEENKEDFLLNKIPIHFKDWREFNIDTVYKKFGLHD